jgi:hypothetical protein
MTPTTPFTWTHPGVNASHFHSLANLLSLRNGGQAELSSSLSLSSIALLEESCTLDHDDDSADGDTHSLATDFAHRISTSGHGRLKRAFLDCVAEVAARKKGGTAVACSAMKEEGEDGVFVWIAWNEGFVDGDVGVFGRIGELLGQLGRSDGGDGMYFVCLLSVSAC